MKHKFKGVLKTYSMAMINTINNEVDANDGKTSYLQQRVGEEAPAGLDERDAKIAQLLNESETYLEKNLLAAANNMSVLTLHSFEICNKFESQKKNQITEEKIVRNIEAHAKFIHQKSVDMRQRLERAASRFN